MLTNVKSLACCCIFKVERTATKTRFETRFLDRSKGLANCPKATASHLRRSRHPAPEGSIHCKNLRSHPHTPWKMSPRTRVSPTVYVSEFLTLQGGFGEGWGIFPGYVGKIIEKTQWGFFQLDDSHINLMIYHEK